MKKIPPFWRRFQMLARPTAYWANKRLKALVQSGTITPQQARDIANGIVHVISNSEAA